ncbi:MAG: hypothetical protein WHS38_08615 [Thermodesulforhabdaceae bacterium]
MTEKKSENQSRKSLPEAIKRVRLEREKTVKRVKELVKEQSRKISAIKSALKDGSKTVPEIAEVSGIPSHEVLWWVASLKKYGVVVEHEKRGSYFAYRVVQNDGQE